MKNVIIKKVAMLSVCLLTACSLTTSSFAKPSIQDCLRNNDSICITDVSAITNYATLPINITSQWFGGYVEGYYLVVRSSYLDGQAQVNYVSQDLGPGSYGMVLPEPLDANDQPHFNPYQSCVQYENQTNFNLPYKEQVGLIFGNHNVCVLKLRFWVAKIPGVTGASFPGPTVKYAYNGFTSSYGYDVNFSD